MPVSESAIDKLEMTNAQKTRLKHTARDANAAVEAFGHILDGTAPRLGHNTYGVAGEQLRTIIQRIERLNDEKAAIAADINEVFAEAKGNGFDVKAIRRIIRLRKMDAAEREEQELVLQVYMRVMGMIQTDMFAENGATEVVS